MRLAVRVLLLDRAAGRVTATLRSESIPSVLLKGVSTQRLLYPGGFRPYGDVDLLVSPYDWTKSISCLKRLGFDDVFRPPNEEKHSRPFRRADGVVVDLHRSLVTASCSPEECWVVLSGRTTTQTCGGEAVAMLDPPALVAVVALHAAQHGHAEPKPIADLIRAVSRMGEDVWQEAAEVAARLGAAETMAAGLRMVPGGDAMAARLGLPGQLSAAVRLRAASAPSASVELARIVAASDREERRRLLRPVLMPTDVELRRRAWARRVAPWPGGRVLARLVWWARLSVEVPGAAAWWWRHRRDGPATP
ncbi:MAG: nucleotidyltransferase family protein [Actinomycetota bacterium]